MNELQRIANVLKINPYEERLCLIIQDKIKEKDEEIKKLTFTNTLLKSQADRRTAIPVAIEVKTNDSEYIDEIKNGFDKAFSGLKKEYNSILEINYRLRQEVEKYREESLMNKIKKIEGVR